MVNSKLTKNSFIIVKHILFLIFFLHILISREANAHREILSKHGYNEIKASILKWWGKNNVAKHLECQYKPESAYSEKLFDMISAPDIKSFPCPENATSPYYFHVGNLKDNILKGKRKLVFLSDDEFLSLSPSDEILEKVLESKVENICFEKHDIYGREIKEIDGTFENGSLHGSAIITYRDNSVSISNFIKGKASGFRRDFDTEKNLIDAGAYDLGWKTGYHWILRFGHLLYQNRDMINDNLPAVVVFPFSKTGTLEDPIAGDYFPQSAALENVRKIQLDATLWSESDCLYHLKYEILDKENYTYSLSSKKKYPLYGQDGYLPLYDAIFRSPYNVSVYSTVMAYLENWFNCIIDFLDIKKTGDYFGAAAAFEVLWQLKPEFSQVDAQNSTRLISDVNIDPDTKNITASVLGSPPVRLFFETGDIKVDKYLNLNGFNDLSVSPEHQPLIPRDATLGWSPIRIIGHFIKGELNGVVLLKTNVSTSVWAAARHGILHGPCVISGISYIIEQVS